MTCNVLDSLEDHLPAKKGTNEPKELLCFKPDRAVSRWLLKVLDTGIVFCAISWFLRPEPLSLL